MHPTNRLTSDILGVCSDVHRHLGPGLLESAYEACVVHALTKQGLTIERQRPVSIHYRGLEVPNAFRLDVLVEATVVLELKAVECLLPVHVAQLMTYVRLARLPVGLIVNFHGTSLRGQVRRVANGAPDLQERSG